MKNQKDPLDSYYFYRLDKPKKPKSNFKRYIFDKKCEYVTTKNYYNMKSEGFPSQEWFDNFDRKQTYYLVKP